MAPVKSGTVLQKIDYDDWNKNGYRVSILREDLIHPYISGNKGRKLKYNLIDFKESGKNTIVTFGGAFSNHLVAIAAASREYGFNAVGIVRGEEVDNPYLSFMKSCGMKLYFVSRELYRRKTDKDFLSRLTVQLIRKKIIADQEVFYIPEGGANAAGVKGSAEICNDIPCEFDYIVCACGTGTTIAGISKCLKKDQIAIGIAVLKGEGFLSNDIHSLGGDPEKIRMIYDYHFGGYAKITSELLEFCKAFTAKTGIPCEPVYTGKLFFAVDDLISKNFFPENTSIAIIHTGGIYAF